MIQSTTSVASLLSDVYQSTTADLNASLTRLSSGKRVQNASDDFTAYFKAATNNTYITQYTSFNQDLQKAKQYADAGLAAGNKVLADLTKLLDLTNQQTSVAGDANANAALSAQYLAIADSMNQTISSTYIDSTKIYQNAAALFNANATIGGQVQNIQIKASASADNAKITKVDDGAATVQTEINAAEKYVAQMQAAQTMITDKISLNNTIINSYNATNSVLTDVNDAQEQLNVTNRQVRLQATASMMAQANASAAAIAKLFQ
jgi:flagellin